MSWLPMLALVLVGCSSATPRAPSPTPTVRSYGGSESHALIREYDGAARASALDEDAGDAASADLQLTVRLAEDAVHVRVVARSEGLERWSAEPGFDELRAHDRTGPLEPLVEDGGVSFDRAVVPPLTLAYRRPAPPHFRESIGLEPWVTHLDGRALLLPTEAPVITIEVAVETDRGVATTLGLGPRHTLEARPIDLRDVTIAAGQVHTARFEERQGRDLVASLGRRVYDVRWVGAEIALIRDGVRTFFAGVDAAEHPTLLVGRPAGDRVPPYSVARSGLGIRVFIRDDAPWTSAARLPVAQVMARRWIGGLLRIEGDDEEPAAWATFGLTRYVAQEVLTSMGTLTSHERAADLTMLEGIVALGGPAGTPADAMARGALYAAALDARLRERGEAPRQLSHLLFPLLRRAQEDPAPITRADLEAVLAAALGDAEVARFRAQVLGEAPVEVPRGAFGPCIRRARARHRRFALGFAEPSAYASTVIVEDVVAGSPAARAGLVDGMELQDVRYRPGDPTTPVRVTVAGDEPRSLEWVAYDRDVRGAGWSRVPGRAEERCDR